jgi:uncharacterized protein YqfA (UPF0365 family)
MSEKEDDLTVHILRDLRAELRSTSERLDRFESATRAEFADVRADLAATRKELRAEIEAVRSQVVESELRTATRITEQTAATRDLYDLVHANLQLRDRVERCEQDIAELKDRSI